MAVNSKIGPARILATLSAAFNEPNLLLICFGLLPEILIGVYRRSHLQNMGVACSPQGAVAGWTQSHHFCLCDLNLFELR